MKYANTKYKRGMSTAFKIFTSSLLLFVGGYSFAQNPSNFLLVDNTFNEEELTVKSEVDSPWNVKEVSKRNAVNITPRPNWADSYSVNGKCYCATTFDHGIGNYEVNTPAGMKTVREICNKIGPGPGKGNNPVYNTVQCGHEPGHDDAIRINGELVKDEKVCPGRVDQGSSGCSNKGPKWDLSVFETNTPNKKPTANFLNIPNNKQYDNGSSLVVEVIAKDDDGSIKSVELFVDNTSIRTEKLARYTWFTAADKAKFAALSNGSHTLKAVATDNDNATTSVSVTIVIGSNDNDDDDDDDDNDDDDNDDDDNDDDSNNGIDELSFSSPVNNQSFDNGNTIAPVVDAKDANGIKSVELFVDDVSIRTEKVAPYTWFTDADKSKFSSLSNGNHTFKALATDNNNKTATISISITIGSVVDDSGVNIPSKIEAEDFTAQKGIKTENTSDVGGGTNVGFILNNDYLEFEVNASNAGSYDLDFRVASRTNGGTIRILSNGSQVGTVAVNSTGNWQSWTTVSTTVDLPAGSQDVRFVFVGGSGYLFNVNWIDFKLSSNASPAQAVQNIANAYPNPSADGIVNLQFEELTSNASFEVLNQSGVVVESGSIQDGVVSSTLDLSSLPSATYYIKIISGGESENITVQIGE